MRSQSNHSGDASERTRKNLPALLSIPRLAPIYFRCGMCGMPAKACWISSARKAVKHWKSEPTDVPRCPPRVVPPRWRHLENSFQSSGANAAMPSGTSGYVTVFQSREKSDRSQTCSRPRRQDRNMGRRVLTRQLRSIPLSPRPFVLVVCIFLRSSTLRETARFGTIWHDSARSQCENSKRSQLYRSRPG